MKIEHVEVSVVRVPPDTPYQASGRTVDAYWHVLARVRTSDGIAGFGYIVALNGALVAAVAVGACGGSGSPTCGARRGTWSCRRRARRPWRRRSTAWNCATRRGSE